MSPRWNKAAQRGTQRNVADVQFSVGGWGETSSDLWRRGPLPQGSKKTQNSNVCLERPRRSSLLTVHRYASQWSILFLFSFCFLFHWLYDVEMLFLSHVSCPVCVSVFSWCGCVCVCARICKVLFLPLLGDIMHGVCVCVYLLVSVLFSLRCRCTKGQQADNGITLWKFFISLKLLFWENLRHECLGQGGRTIRTPKYCCSITFPWTANYFCARIHFSPDVQYLHFHPQLNLQSLTLWSSTSGTMLSTSTVNLPTAAVCMAFGPLGGQLWPIEL